MNKPNYLDKILLRKRKEVELLITKRDPKLQALLLEERSCRGRFSAALKKQHLAVIGEIKRKSPSLGEISAIEDPVELAMQYCHGGVSAISVLTDEVGFGGSIEDLRKISNALAKSYPAVAILRKDFILHPLQIAEASAAGADAVLLIVNAVKDDLKHLLKLASRLGIEVLTEAHDSTEIEIALEAGATIIGVNHRNLETFKVDIGISDTLRPLIPAGHLAVAESGIHTAAQALKMRALGYDAVLVGEALVRAEDPSALIREMQGALR